jgi:class 3 adenylate cyclase
MSLAMRDELAHMANGALQVRSGMHTGLVVAGVSGIQKFSYDLWDDTMNLASRMASHGCVGEIRLTRATYEKLHERYAREPRGTITVKERGEIEAWRLMGKT